MKEVSDYLKGQRLLKQQKIKEASVFIPKILKLCQAKGLDFSFSYDISLIDVRNVETGFVLNGYFSETLVDYQDEETNCYTLPNLYKELKKYKK